MASEKLKKWIRQKQDEGISDERIKKSLEKTGYDPSIVDELNDPFDPDSSTETAGEDLFSSADQDSEDSSMGLSEENREERVSEIADNLSDRNSDSGESSFDRKSFSNDHSFSDKEDSESSFKHKLPSFSLPSKPDLPSFDRPGKPSVDLPSPPTVSRKQLAIVFTLLLVLGGGFTVYSLIPEDFNHELLFGPSIGSSTNLDTLRQLDTKFSGCPDAGVSLESISSSGGTTAADVLVTDQAWVVLEVMENGRVIGFSTKQVDGESQMTVNEVGDEAQLRPLGCHTRYSRESY